MDSELLARRQRVVYTGLYLNEVPRIDIAQSIFTADFYLWLRYEDGSAPGLADPTEIDFPDLVRGSFDSEKARRRRRVRRWNGLSTLAGARRFQE
jgi:hypothetical protein